MSDLEFSRRRFVRGATGASLALPWLAPYIRVQAADPAPKRLIIFYVPEGVEPDYWWPTNVRSPTDYDLPYSTAPLAAMKKHITFLPGFKLGTGYHWDGVDDMLTGGINSPSQTFGPHTFPGGVTVDQVIAKFIQGTSPIRSYQLGTKTATQDRVEYISFESKSVRRSPQQNPVKAMSDLLSGVDRTDTSAEAARRLRLTQRRSLLDDVLPELAAVRCPLGKEGQAKLDQHTSSIRDLEKQLDNLLAAPATKPTGPAVTVDPALGTPQAFTNTANYPKVGRAQTDVLVAALAADVTRVATLQWSHTSSGLQHPFLPINYKSETFHGISHHNDGGLDDAKCTSDKKEIFRFYTQQFAYLVEKLAAVPEGSGTLLDNSLVLWCSEMAEGHFHYSSDIPFLAAGRGGGAFRAGSILHGGNGSGTRFNNELLAAVAKGFGVPCTRFGEGRGGNAFDAFLA